MKKPAATDAVAAPSNHTLKEEKMDPQKLVEHFSMSPHPEGGFFAETYRSQGAIPADALPGFGGTRNFSTGILFLLRRGEYSHLHRLKQDEMWHFYLGAPLRLAIVRPDGTAEEVLLGQDVLNGQYLQYTVPGGCWFGATPAEGSDFALVGCTVAPGFDFADFEMADPDVLGQNFPHAAGLVREFC